ncbi:MAG: hypothetical protein ACI8ZB_005515 [Desulforhopalus sp.]|jgi:hypothetical protein
MHQNKKVREMSSTVYGKKLVKKTKRSNHEVKKRMLQLSAMNYNCSQIMTLLALEQAGYDNTDLVRAMSGLGDGCGFLNETCGVMTSAACLLAWYGGNKSGNETESDLVPPMLQDLGEWFRQKTANKCKGTRCKDILGDQVGTPTGKKLCGALIFETHNKVNEILTSYGFSGA